MAVIAGTITNYKHIDQPQDGWGNVEVWQISASFGAYTGAADTCIISGVAAALNARIRDGKTRVLRDVIQGNPGRDTDDQLVYGPTTVASADISGNLSNSAGAELTTATASVGVNLFVSFTVS